MDDKSAIMAALDCRWEEAVTLNNKIIKEDPDNIDALNRIAHAYFELGNIKSAKKNYSQVLKLDQYNPIAIKNLKIIKAFKDEDGIRNNNHTPISISSSLFLQEPGKTKVVALLKVAEPQKLSQVSCGMSAQLLPKGRGITVLDPFSEYLGVLPDDIAFTMLRLLKGGNKYDAYIKSINFNGLSILIRETYRSAKFKNQPSFLEFSTSSREYTPHIELNTGDQDDLILGDEEETLN